MDFLFGLGQVLCIIGLLCGAYFSITYVDREEPSLTADAKVQPATRYDPLTGHVWTIKGARLDSFQVSKNAKTGMY